MKTKEYYIAILPHYYMPETQGRDRVSWIENANGYPESYPTVQEAKEAIEALESEIIYLHNGEYSRPDFFVVSQDDYEYISSCRFGDQSNYDWDETGCGECMKCCRVMIEQDRNFVVAVAL